MSKTVTITTDVDVDIEIMDFDDDALVEEIIDRIENMDASCIKALKEALFDSIEHVETLEDSLKMEAIMRGWKNKSIQEIEEFFAG